MKTGAKQARANNPEAELQSFIEKFDAQNQASIRELRRSLQKRLPHANELVYDNYNFFVIGYCHTERTSDAILSLIADRNGLGIAFPYVGARLPDPHRVLQGSGSRNRFIRVNSAGDLKRPEFEALVEAAVKLCKPAAPGAKPRLIIRSFRPSNVPAKNRVESPGPAVIHRPATPASRARASNSRKEKMPCSSDGPPLATNSDISSPFSGQWASVQASPSFWSRSVAARAAPGYATR